MTPINVLYLSYNSLQAPLVQSQVLPYLRNLVQLGHRFSLVTFEKGQATRPGWSRLEDGICWHAVNQASGSPGLVRALRSVSQLVGRTLAFGAIDLVHARSYLPAWIAMRQCRRHGIPWLFDMRGFWVDEKVLKGSLRRASLGYWFLKREEKRLLRQASAIVSLTEKALPTIDHLLGPGSAVPVSVIPTCVELNRFRLPDNRMLANDAPVFGYVGSLGRGYDAKRNIGFMREALRRYPSGFARIITRSDRRLLDDLVKEFPTRVSVQSVDHEYVPEEIAKMHIGISFIDPHFSKDASCPTKLAEYLACGVPVIGNGDIGDVAGYMGTFDVGVSVDSGMSTDAVFREVSRLLNDPGTANRCRQCAEKVFSVESGAHRYHELYAACDEGRL